MHSQGLEKNLLNLNIFLIQIRLSHKTKLLLLEKQKVRLEEF